MATWPYYWTFRNYTLDPIKRIRDAASDPTLQAQKVVTFLVGKRQELKFVNTASTISAAATVGALSWSSINDTPWPALALWYCSLSLAIFALITSNQHSALMDSSLGPPSSNMTNVAPNFGPGTIMVVFTTNSPDGNSASIRLSGQPSNDFEKQVTADFALFHSSDWHTKHLVYIWQCPLMLMSWSWVTYLIAQTLHIARPLFRRSVGTDDKKVAIAYLSICCIIVVNFAWCSFWFYRTASAFKAWRVEDGLPESAVSTILVRETITKGQTTLASLNNDDTKSINSEDRKSVV